MTITNELISKIHSSL